MYVLEIELYTYFFYCSSRVQGVLGYQPQELLGKICFDYFHPEDETHMKESFEQGILYFLLS